MLHDEAADILKDPIVFFSKHSPGKPVPLFVSELEKHKGLYHIFDFGEIDLKSSMPLYETGAEFWREGILEPPFEQVIYSFRCAKEKLRILFSVHREETGASIFVHGEHPNLMCEVSTSLWKMLIENGNTESFLIKELGAEDSPHLDVQKTVFFAFFHLTMLLCTKYIKKERIDPPTTLNKKRAKRGKPPLHPYTIVRLQDRQSGVGAGRCGSSPRPHWRRGHIRRLSNGLVVPVAPCLVCADGRVLPPQKYLLEKGAIGVYTGGGAG